MHDRNKFLDLKLVVVAYRGGIAKCVQENLNGEDAKKAL